MALNADCMKLEDLNRFPYEAKAIGRGYQNKKIV